MNKQKVLHALRGLEMTFEQKQELIEALAEGESAEGGEITIDVSPITVNQDAHMDLTDDEINAIKNNYFKFIDIYEGAITNYYIWNIKVNNDSIDIRAQFVPDGNANTYIVDLNNKWLSRVDTAS